MQFRASVGQDIFLCSQPQPYDNPACKMASQFSRDTSIINNILCNFRQSALTFLPQLRRRSPFVWVALSLQQSVRCSKALEQVDWPFSLLADNLTPELHTRHSGLFFNVTFVPFFYGACSVGQRRHSCTHTQLERAHGPAHSRTLRMVSFSSFLLWHSLNFVSESNPS